MRISTYTKHIPIFNCILFSSIVSLLADTNVGGFISTNSTWRSADSPFVVTMSLIVSPSVTLTIEPGVTVKLDPAKGIAVEGTLVAKGSAESNIVFTANATSPDLDENRWGYISFSDTATDATFAPDGTWVDGCIFEHVMLEYSGNTPAYSGVNIEQSSPCFINCTFRYNSQGALFAQSATGIRFIGCLIQTNQSPAKAVVRFDSSMRTLISNNQFVDNVGISAGGVFLDKCNQFLVVSNTFINNQATDWYSQQGGGGLNISSGSNVTSVWNYFIGNSCAQSGGGYNCGIRLLLLSCTIGL
jgi:hypothetical protein